MNYAQTLGERAKVAAPAIANASPKLKNEALAAIAAALLQQTDRILQANAEDLAAAVQNNMTESLQDRLRLTPARMQGMADAIEKLIAMDDPVGVVESGSVRPNGLQILKTRVPLGIIGIIFESRPNVTVDAATLCLKAGNAVILRGGKEAIHSNTCLMNVMREAVESVGLPADIMQLVEDTSRQTASDMMQLNGYLDVLIPRGGKGLIRAVVEQSTIPVIETGTGNCHTYVDETADLKMAADIIMNAKTQRVGVCNACESVLVHEKVKDALLPVLAKRLQEKHVEIRADQAAYELIPGAVHATEEDWGKEYLDYILSVKVVSSVEEAIAHINKYNTKHSEAIITNNYEHSQKFLEEVDAAAVYVNASTRFTDGFEFGFGAEIGISTQKLHARGPMGLLALTSIKFVVYGNGQVRS